MKKVLNFTFKLFLLMFIMAGFSVTINAQNAWINEFHYDNAGTDVNESIEIVIENPGSFTLSLFSVVLYNGNGGAVYGTKYLNDFTAGSTSGSFTLYHYPYPTNGIQNGPDAIALAYDGVLIPGQFLSYEGAFTGIGGAADGVPSTNIGVSETSSTPADHSLQLSGTGGSYSEFTWQAPATATAGALNNSQTLTSGGISNPVNFNAAAYSTTQIDLSWTLNTNSDSVVIAQNSTDTFGTPSGTYPIGGVISGGGTVIYKGTGTTTSHTGLTDNTEYFYKAWSKTAAHEYSSGVNDSATTLKVEPSNYPADFTATATGITIMLDWTDAVGTQIPDAYLIRISDQDNITAPTDGVAVEDDTDLSDGTGGINVDYGQESCTFYRLEETTDYYFKIYPYTNSGNGINFKTDGSAPSANDETQSIINVNDFESNTFGTWDTVSLASVKNWSVYSGNGAYGTQYYANMNGYQTSGDVLEDDWLISPSLNLDVYTDEKMIFFTYWQYSTETDELKLKYSTDYTSGDPSAATWFELTFTKSPVAFTWVPSGFIDLSSISGNNVHIAFHYVSTATPRSWSVDEIEITGNGVSDPSNFDATTVSSTQIDLSWNKNNNDNDVMVAWSLNSTFGTPIGTYPIGGLIIGGGTVLYKGQAESFNHTGRNPSTAYYYKAWSVDGSNIYSAGVSDSASTQFTEPSNHPTGLAAVSNGPSQITVSWTDSDAAHYLVKGSSEGYGSIVPPIDGVGQDDSLLVQNVDASVQSHQFTGLTPSTPYYFKIFPYNGGGESSNYKTNGTIPETSATTDDLNMELIISEIADPLDNSNTRFVEIKNTGLTEINFTSDPVFLCKQANGGATWNSVALTGTMAPGVIQVVAYSVSYFDTAYNAPADQYAGSVANFNGDDGVFLYYGGDQTNGILMDAFGEVDVRGDTTDWFYQDGHVVRNRGILSPNSIWTASEWSIVRNVNYDNMTPYLHAANVTWQGTSSTDWNARGTNWNGTYGWVPDASCIVTIPNVSNSPIITEPSGCHGLDIQSGASLSIQSTGSLLIVGP